MRAPSNLPARMHESVAKYRRLDSQKIVETVRALQARVEDRFPGSGLGKLVAELLRVAEETITRTEWIQKPHLPLRAGAVVLSIAIVVLLIAMLVNIRHFQFEEYTNFIQALEASISSVLFIGAAIVFLVSWENRIKRQRALKAIHELRAMAHIVDMHQLTKDPESYFGSRNPTPASPQRRQMTPLELNRYLDYCSESLAVISKIAALYVQGFHDPVLLDAVDDVEDLTSGFSRKIWQKLTILESFGRTLKGEE
jgi:hypothetical protein